MNTHNPGFFFDGTVAEIADHAASLIIVEAYRSVANHGRFSMVLAGGTSPRILYQKLAEGVTTELLEHYNLPVPEWRKQRRLTHHPLPGHTWFFQGDERCVPIDHPESNYKMIRESLLSSTAMPEHNFLRMKADEADTEAAARRYEGTIRSFFFPGKSLSRERFPVFDLILLGLGDDGHTASLFADNPAILQEKRRWVLPVNAPKGKPPGMRLTLTLPIINHARNIIFFTTGKDKSELAKKIFLEKESGLPATLVKPENGIVYWFTSRA